MDHMAEVKALRANTQRHYNCAQAILVPFSDITGMSKEMAFKLGALFGSGMNCGETCGTITGALMVLGMMGYDKGASVALIRFFKQKHGDTQCRNLLAASAKKGVPQKMHCDGLVYEMCKYLDSILGEQR